MTEKAAVSPEKYSEAAAVAWHKINKKWSTDYVERILTSMKSHIFPTIGHLPVTMLKMQRSTTLLKVVEDKGFLEIASRTQQQLYDIMRYAVRQGLTDNNPALHLEGVTTPPVRNRYPAPSLERLLELFERVGDYQQGRESIRLTVVLTPRLFTRPSELRFIR